MFENADQSTKIALYVVGAIVIIAIAVMVIKFGMPLVQSNLNQREAECNTMGGEWVSDQSQIGCYNIPEWDSNHQCLSTKYLAAKTACASAGGYFTCNGEEVGCDM